MVQILYVSRFAKLRPYLIALGSAATVTGGVLGTRAIVQHHHASQISPKEKTAFFCIATSSEQIIANVGKETPEGLVAEPHLVSLSSDFQGKPLFSMVCHEDGRFWAIDDTFVYQGQLKMVGDDCCKLDVSNRVPHNTLPEYANTKVVDGAILWPLDKERPYMATLTNDGFLLFFIPPGAGQTIIEKSTKDIKSIKGAHWPDGVLRARVGVLGPYFFSATPFGETSNQSDGGVSVPVFYEYFFRFKESLYKDIHPELFPTAFDIREQVPDALSILGAEPIVYDKARGGWVSVHKVATKNGIIDKDLVMIPGDLLK